MTSHTTSTSTGGGSNPSAWPADTLDRFGATDEIDISTRRDDDNLRGFVPIWIVTVDNALCTCAPTADTTAPGTDTPPRDRRRDPDRRPAGRRHLHPDRPAPA